MLSLHRLREVVLRDLEWLLNSVNLTSTEDLDDFPHIARSVLNYGTPDLAGHTTSGVDVAQLERLLQQSIQDFEPRILRKTLKVRVHVDDEKMSRNALTLDIEGEMWSQPVPLHLYLKTEIDLETGNVTVADNTRQRPG